MDPKPHHIQMNKYIWQEAEPNGSVAQRLGQCVASVVKMFDDIYLNRVGKRLAM